MSKEKELNDFKNLVYKELLKIIEENYPKTQHNDLTQILVSYQKEELGLLINEYESSTEESPDGILQSELSALLEELYISENYGFAAYWVDKPHNKFIPTYHTYLSKLIDNVYDRSNKENSKGVIHVYLVMVINQFESKEIADLLRKTYL